MDPFVPHTGSAETNEDDAGGAESNPEEVITNAHGALPTDGLLSSSELTELFAVPTHPRSLYDEGRRLLDTTSDLILRYGERLDLPPHRRGAYEPDGQVTHITGSLNCNATYRELSTERSCKLHLGR